MADDAWLSDRDRDFSRNMRFIRAVERAVRPMYLLAKLSYESRVKAIRHHSSSFDRSVWEWLGRSPSRDVRIAVAHAPNAPADVRFKALHMRILSDLIPPQRDCQRLNPHILRPLLDSSDKVHQLLDAGDPEVAAAILRARLGDAAAVRKALWVLASADAAWDDELDVLTYPLFSDGYEALPAELRDFAAEVSGSARACLAAVAVRAEDLDDAEGTASGSTLRHR